MKTSIPDPRQTESMRRVKSQVERSRHESSRERRDPRRHWPRSSEKKVHHGARKVTEKRPGSFKTRNKNSTRLARSASTTEARKKGMTDTKIFEQTQRSHNPGEPTRGWRQTAAELPNGRPYSSHRKNQEEREYRTQRFSRLRGKERREQP